MLRLLRLLMLRFAQTLRQPPVMQFEPTFGVGTADNLIISHIFYPLCQICRGTFKFSIGQSGSLLRLKDWRALKESFLSPFTPFQTVQWSIMSIDVGSLRWKAGGQVVLSIARLLPGFPESDTVEYRGRWREGNGRDFRCHKMPRDATKMETETETKWDIPVVPARGGAEVALKIYIKLFSSIELACAVRQPSPCVRALCETGVLFHMSHLKLHFTLHTWQSSHYTLHSPHFTLHSLHSKRHTSQSTRHTSQSTLHTSHFSLLASHSKLHTSHSTPHTSHCTLHTSHFI